MYPDDGMAETGSHAEAAIVSVLVQTCFRNFGIFLPTRNAIGNHLTLSHEFSLFYPREMAFLSISFAHIDSLRGHLYFAAKMIAGFVGQVISMQTVIVCLRARLLSRASWNANVYLNSDAFDELTFLFSYL